MRSIVCHIDGDKTDKQYKSLCALTSALVDKYGLSSPSQVEYKTNGSSTDILIKSKMGSYMRMVGFYYEVTD